MFILMLQKSRFLVAATEQGVVLGRLLAADTHLTRLQRLQGREGDTKALCSHGRSSRLQVLVLGSGFLDPILALNSSTEWDLDNLALVQVFLELFHRVCSHHVTLQVV